MLWINISRAELSALRLLRRRDDLVIKPADKGGAVVVWRADLYQEEALRQLRNPLFYHRLICYHLVMSAEMMMYSN